MPTARINNADIAYLDEGAGEPVILVHGFASTKEVNWVNPGWIRLLTEAGYRAIALDNRGHGGSTKFHDSADYSLALMAGDVAALARHLDLDSPHLIGYSMGARISAWLARHAGEMFNHVVLAGNGISMIEGSGDWTPVRDALLAPSLDAVSDPRGRAFRKFADQTGSDRLALAECVTAVRQLFVPDDFRGIANPVLVAIGTDDDIAGSGQPIVDLLPNGQLLDIPGRDHMRAVGDKVFMQRVLDFLAA